MMTSSDWIQFSSLLVAVVAFVAAQLWRLRQEQKKDARSRTKLRIFEILGSESMSLKTIWDKYCFEDQQISKDELSRAIYEMLAEETAWYERTDEYRAHWRNPKEKRN